MWFTGASTVGEARGYEDLLPLSEEVNVGSLRVRVISLEVLIHLKEQAGRPKDLAALPVLRQTLRETRRRDG